MLSKEKKKDKYRYYHRYLERKICIFLGCVLLFNILIVAILIFFFNEYVQKYIILKIADYFSKVEIIYLANPFKCKGDLR